MLRSLALAALCATVAMFCGNAGDELPPTVAVSGRVTYGDGTPLTNLEVVFSPLGQEEQPASRGRLSPGGTFKLSTYQENDGAPPGKYRVYFVPKLPDRPAAEEHHSGDLTAATAAPADEIVAAEYLVLDRTPLVAEIDDVHDRAHLELSVKRPEKRQAERSAR
jgi:hypothetical protein